MDTKRKTDWRLAEAHFQDRANALLEGAFGWLLEHYRFPFIVFDRNEVTLEVTPERSQAVLSDQRDLLRRDGVAHINVALFKLEASGQSSLKASTFWQYYSEQGDLIYCAIYHYFGQMTPRDTFAAEMLEYEAPETNRPPARDLPWFLH